MRVDGLDRDRRGILNAAVGLSLDRISGGGGVRAEINGSAVGISVNRC